MKSPKSPKPPNYAAAAQATAEGNAAAARVAAQANRADQVTPYGNLTWESLGDDRWKAIQTLSPDQQRLLDLEEMGDITSAELANTGLLKARGVLEDPTVNMEGLPDPISGEGAQAAIMARLQPNLDRQRDQLNTQMINQGFGDSGSGNQARVNAFREQNERENDLYTQAALRGIDYDVAARKTGIAERAYQQDRPINLINALRSGAQVQSPNWVNVPQQATTAGPDMMGAASDMYSAQMGGANAKSAQNASNMQAGVGLVGAMAVM